MPFSCFNRLVQDVQLSKITSGHITCFSSLIRIHLRCQLRAFANSIIHEISIRAIWRSMIFVNETWEISPTPMVNMRPSSILFKRPVVVEHVIEYYWKYRSWSTVPSSKMTKGHIRLEDASSQTITLLGNFCICWMAPFASASARLGAQILLFWEF